MIKLDDLHPVVVDKLIYYLYHSDYDDTGFWQEEVEEDKHDLGLEVMEGEQENEEMVGDGGDNLGEYGQENDEEGAEKGHQEEDTDKDGKEETPQKESQLLTLNASMYIIGDRFDLGQLKDLAKEKFSAALIERWDKENLSDLIRTIYENTLPNDRGLRDCLVPTLLQHKKALREDETFMEVVQSHGDFAVDLVDAWGGRKSAGHAKIKLTSTTSSTGSWDEECFISSTGSDGMVCCPDCRQKQIYSRE